MKKERKKKNRWSRKKESVELEKERKKERKKEQVK